MGRYLRRLSRQAGEKSGETRAGNVGEGLVKLRRVPLDLAPFGPLRPGRGERGQA